jgi:hypothetical protein
MYSCGCWQRRYVNPGNSVNEITESHEDDGTFPPYHHDQSDTASHTIPGQVIAARYPEMRADGS